MPAFLRISKGSGPPGPIPVPTNRPALIGRGEGCDIQIDDRSLSRLHCSIELDSSGWHVADCRSTNGTRVGGFRISETLIWPGEAIEIGDVRLEFDVSDREGSRAYANPNGVRHPLAGRYFSRFELLSRVHVGSSGTVYLCRESDRNREVALKLFSESIAIDDAARKRFEQVVHALASLQHPAIVQTYAAGKTEGQAWLSMEWVDGPSLNDVLNRQESISPAEAVRIIRCVTSAIDAAARQGIVHGHIKPSSILFTASGEPKLGDFVLDTSRCNRSVTRDPDNDKMNRDAGYVAPECFDGATDIDSRADIYSLGVCLFSLLRGHTPSKKSAVRRVQDGACPIPDPVFDELRPLPAELHSVLAKCLAKDRDDRFQSPEQLFAALAELGDMTPTPVTHGDADEHGKSSPTVFDAAPPESPITSVDDEPVSLPSSPSPTTGSIRRFLIIPAPANAPAEHPWSTLLITIALVVGIGSLILFRDRFPSWRRGQDPDKTSGIAVRPEPVVPEEPKKTITKKVEPSPTPPVIASKQLATALADPDRLVVQPGTTLRNIGDALAQAQDGQVIEVASNDTIRSEIKVPAKSLNLVANPQFHPVFRNTMRINGGGTIRVEGFHFEPYVANKPAIEIEQMPDRLELAGCTFRGADGVLVVIRSTSPQPGKRPALLLDRSFAAGNIVFGLTGLPPDLQMNQTCLVVDQAVLDWQLSTGDSGAVGGDWSVTLQESTFVSRSVFQVRLDDQKSPIAQLPRTTIQLDNNFFAFPSRYPCTFFRWEAWQRPDIVQERFSWRGTTNAFSGLGTWSIATTLAVSDPGATPQVVIESPDDWKRQWAEEIGEVLKLPPQFRYLGPPKPMHQMSPADYELTDELKQRAVGKEKKPLGADIATIPVPPAVH